MSVTFQKLLSVGYLKTRERYLVGLLDRLMDQTRMDSFHIQKPKLSLCNKEIEGFASFL